MKRVLPPLLAAAAFAQDIDTVVFETDRKSYRLLDQIADAEERARLAAVFQTRDPRERLRRAVRFAAGYPASGFLSVAYDIAAKSCIDLRDPACLFDNAARSLRLLPENPLLLISLAEAQRALGQGSAAAENARLGLEYLDRFAPSAGFEPKAWLALEPGLRHAAAIAVGASPPPQPGRSGGKAEYAGTSACAPCHARQHANWKSTGMARMFAPYRPENVAGDFTAPSPEPAIRPRLDNGVHSFDVAGKRYPVHFTIGSKWQQAYATRLASGRIHVFPIQYNRLAGAWVNYWKEIDPPGSTRHRAERFAEFSDATLYQRNCAPCHTSQLRAGAALPEFAEPGVNCEMCHGPSAAHVRERAAGRAVSKPASSPPVDFTRLDAPRYVAICAQCHRQSAVVRQGPRGERNYSGGSPDFVLPARLRPYLEFSRRAFYKDGRFRETTFIVEALERSSCYRKGGAHCGACHTPHPADFPANLKALRFVDEPDRMCSQCHAALTRDLRRHTRHAPESEASRCVACHMPRIANSVGFAARSHQIDDIPDAEMTARFGAAESPNACLDCHAARGIAWVAAELKRWRAP